MQNLANAVNNIPFQIHGQHMHQEILCDVNTPDKMKAYSCMYTNSMSVKIQIHKQFECKT